MAFSASTAGKGLRRPLSRRELLGALLVAVLLAYLLIGGVPRPAPAKIYPLPAAATSPAPAHLDGVTVVTLNSSLQAPWGMAFLPDGACRLLLSVTIVTPSRCTGAGDVVAAGSG